MGSRFLLRSLGAAVVTLGLALSGSALAIAAPMADADGDGVFDDLESRVRHVSGERDMRVIVTLSKDATRARAAGLEQAVGSLDVKRRFGIVDAVTGVVDADEVSKLSQADGVLQVERDTPVRAMNAGAQRWFGVSEIRLDLPALTGDGDGDPTSYSKDDLVAAVLDTGIHATHESLDNGKVLAFQDFTDGNYSDVDAPFDDEGHGTHVSATIAGDLGTGDGRGVAPGAGLVGLKVLDSKGKGNASDIIAALQWIDPDGAGPATGGGVTYGIEAVNLSLGATGCSNGLDAESAAVNALVDANYVVAVAAGNDGPAGCTADTGISTPAAAAKAITVGAMADVDEDGFYLADFSSRGPTLDGRVKPDISAPGVGIRSAFNNASLGAATASGTSMAAPFVAGVALLMRALNPALSAFQVKQKIMQTAIDWGPTGADSQHGAGRLDAYAALASAAAPGQLISPPSGLPPFERVESSLGAAGSAKFFEVADTASLPLAVGLTVGAASTNFDMYLYDSSGNQVAKAALPFLQEELHLPSSGAGPYLLKVQSVAGSGAFFLDVSGGDATATSAPPPPANSVAPAVPSSPVIGETITGTLGSWSEKPAVTLASQWESCTTAGTGCVGMGVTGTSYTVRATDAGRALRLAVTGTSVGGSTTAYSNLAVVPVESPANLAAPLVTGDAREGARLNAGHGSWSGAAPMSFSYSWMRCDPLAGVCSTVPGAFSAEYLPSSLDVGKRLRVVVTATNAGGSASAVSADTATVAAAPRVDDGVSELVAPANVKRPTISGRARQGSTLRGRRGRWRGTTPIAFSYRWLRCNAAGKRCQKIRGATSSRYRLRAVDIGHRVVLRVTATNISSGARATARPTRVVRRSRR